MTQETFYRLYRQGIALSKLYGDYWEKFAPLPGGPVDKHNFRWYLVALRLQVQRLEKTLDEESPGR